MLEEYQAIRQEMISMEEESQSIGLKDPRQLPFYQTLEHYVPGSEHESIKDLTEIITEIIQENAVIDWTEKEDVKREMRKKVKRQLRSELHTQSHS